MIARRMADGIVELDALDSELEIIMFALVYYADDSGSRSDACRSQADDKRKLSARQLRGKHALERDAGELERMAALLRDRANRATDLVRVISGIDRPSRSQLPTPSQTEEGSHVDE